MDNIDKIKDTINSNITNKTDINSISPLDVGNSIIEILDYLGFYNNIIYANELPTTEDYENKTICITDTLIAILTDGIWKTIYTFITISNEDGVATDVAVSQSLFHSIISNLTARISALETTIVNINTLLSTINNTTLPNIETTLNDKVNKTDLDSINTTISSKANISDVNTALALKAEATDITTINQKLSTKLSKDDLDSSVVTKDNFNSILISDNSFKNKLSDSDLEDKLTKSAYINNSLDNINLTLASMPQNDDITDVKIAIAKQESNLSSKLNIADLEDKLKLSTTISSKANISDVNTALALKAEATDITTINQKLSTHDSEIKNLSSIEISNKYDDGTAENADKKAASLYLVKQKIDAVASPSIELATTEESKLKAASTYLVSVTKNELQKQIDILNKNIGHNTVIIDSFVGDDSKLVFKSTYKNINANSIIAVLQNNIMLSANDVKITITNDVVINLTFTKAPTEDSKIMIIDINGKITE